VWRKLAAASILANIADPLLYMVALGFGIGAFIPEVDGMKYIAFLGTAMVCQSTMFTSSFEAMYSAFSRMHVQRTWEAIINAPVSLDDVVVRRMDLGGLEGGDLDGRDPRRDHGARIRPFVARAVDHPARLSSSASRSAGSGSS
jgi:Nod factor-specific ABC transporter NodJ protein